MEDVEEDESEEHEGGVEDILVGFVAGNAAVDALGVFDETEYYTNLVKWVSVVFRVWSERSEWRMRRR